MFGSGTPPYIPPPSVQIVQPADQAEWAMQLSAEQARAIALRGIEAAIRNRQTTGQPF